MLNPKEMLNVQSTLVSMRNLRRFFDKHAEYDKIDATTV